MKNLVEYKYLKNSEVSVKILSIDSNKIQLSLEKLLCNINTKKSATDKISNTITENCKNYTFNDRSQEFGEITGIKLDYKEDIMKNSYDLWETSRLNY